MNFSRDYSRVGVYSNEVYYLGQYLKNKPLDLANKVYQFLRWHESDEILERAGITREALEEAEDNTVESDDIYELAQKIESVMEESEKEKFAQKMSFDYPEEGPSWTHMDVQTYRLPRQTWLVHFSDQAGKIVDEGFTQGVYDVERLALTRHLHENEKKYGGYNFAFVAGDRDSQHVASSVKYGNGAVMFQSSGIEVYHYGDRENQVIYWGKAIDPRTVVELAKEDRDNWMVAPRWKSSMSNRGRDFVYKGTFSDVVDWVEKHWFQYRRQIMGR